MALEYFCRKTGCGLFAMGSHTKKRPHNLVLGRFYNHHIYDMIELGVIEYMSLGAFGCARSQLGGKVGLPSVLSIRSILCPDCIVSLVV